MWEKRKTDGKTISFLLLNKRQNSVVKLFNGCYHQSVICVIRYFYVFNAVLICFGNDFSGSIAREDLIHVFHSVHYIAELIPPRANVISFADNRSFVKQALQLVFC